MSDDPTPSNEFLEYTVETMTALEDIEELAIIIGIPAYVMLDLSKEILRLRKENRELTDAAIRGIEKTL